MKKIVYSPDAIEKIREIDRIIRREFGSSIAQEDFMYKLFGISNVDDEAENYRDDIEHDNNP